MSAMCGGRCSGGRFPRGSVVLQWVESTDAWGGGKVRSMAELGPLTAAPVLLHGGPRRRGAPSIIGSVDRSPAGNSIK